jgi:hypothetical protein
MWVQPEDDPRKEEETVDSYGGAVAPRNGDRLVNIALSPTGYVWRSRSMYKNSTSFFLTPFALQ